MGSNAPIRMPSGKATADAARNEMTMRFIEAQMAGNSVCSKIIDSVACSTLIGDGRNNSFTIGLSPRVSTHQTMITSAGMPSAKGTRMLLGSDLRSVQIDSRDVSRCFIEG